MNPLSEYPEIRKILYTVQWIINLGMGAASVALLALGESPKWFIVVGLVLNFIWTYTGVTASSNTPPAKEGDLP